jgi:hypothetical protein
MSAIKIHEGEQRCETLLQALKNLVYERGVGLSLPLIIGTIEILKHEIYKEQNV